MRSLLKLLVACLAGGTLAACTDGPTLPTTPSPGKPLFWVWPADPSLTCFSYVVGRGVRADYSGLCTTRVSASPVSSAHYNGFYVGPDQREPLTIVFSQPVYEVIVQGSGGHFCAGDYGAVIAMSDEGAAVQSPLTLQNPGDCGGDNTAGETIDTLPPAMAIRSLVIVPMNPATWTWPIDSPEGPVMTNGEASAGYILFFRETPPQPQATVRLTKASEGLVAPKGLGPQDQLRVNVAVVDGQGVPMPNRTVLLALAPVEGSAGHEHVGGKPAGTIAPRTVQTGPTGIGQAIFEAPAVSGPVLVVGSSDGAAGDTVTIEVGIGGLVELAETPGIHLIGRTASHPSNHWGTPEMVAALEALASGFSGEFGGSVEVNDMSLAAGGLFDIGAAWTPPHAEHRNGNMADIRTRALSPEQLNFLRALWERSLRHTLRDETRTDAPHFHLRF